MKHLTEVIASSIFVYFLSLTFPVKGVTFPAMVTAISIPEPQNKSLRVGDKCNDDSECRFNGSMCDSVLKLCQCTPEFPVTDHEYKCGKPAAVNDSCTFKEQCEQTLFPTECRDGRCLCRFDKVPIANSEGIVECQTLPKETKQYSVDPTMIGILAGMALMFVILCVVLRLFSKARWRENRTIFNTPNPRLMNASLLQHNKSFHEGRRGSRASVRGPSRAGSLNSLRTHSPTGSLGSRNGGTRSRCNSRDESTPDVRSPTRKEKGHSSELETLKDETVFVQRNA